MPAIVSFLGFFAPFFANLRHNSLDEQVHTLSLLAL